MNACNNKTYELISRGVNTIYSDGTTNYNLGIVDKNGDLIAEAYSIFHTMKVTGSLWWKRADEYLRVKDGYVRAEDDYYKIVSIKDLSIKLQNKKFVVIDSNNNTLTEIHSFALTEYGEEALSECFGNTLEYYAPTDHPQNSFSDYSNGDTDHELTNLDIL